ncbi:copper chaperone CopZ [Ulvibacter sp. MAR_2010_11]|uniref:heavy-metal-associated domain-containing protein n=1 Tax=Ulvibacter sp. MAR_2010_11 TaxID=1250229 RepID=UPI000C2CD7BF|nr:heavy-metal-associated domain-containing protein [Ulvibacter sp. MAR_2010_11]PKA84513.1 copper chaperone CopZ [Ulvibacter sp. MAR_2010_11]
METIKFKTNIKCTGCLSKATTKLDEKLGEGNWEVDLFTLKKTLTVTSTNMSESEVIAAVNEAGYTAERLS